MFTIHHQIKFLNESMNIFQYQAMLKVKSTFNQTMLFNPVTNHTIKAKSTQTHTNTLIRQTSVKYLFKDKDINLVNIIKRIVIHQVIIIIQLIIIIICIVDIVNKIIIIMMNNYWKIYQGIKICKDCFEIKKSTI